MPKVTRKRKLVLGITGGIATGKSTVMAMLAKAKIPTISSDELAHDCIRKGKPAYHLILKAFGPVVLASDRQIDRKKLGRIIFDDSIRRHQLEAIVHPCVSKGLRQFIKGHQGLMALDIPLLFEAGYQDWVDFIIVVSSTPTQQLKRLMRRNRLSLKDAKRRLASQIPVAEKRRRADLVLDNGRTLESLRSQVKKLLKDLKRA
jgi:dephospho-CoA kinase